ncbi:MAG: putative toxin-antitoxin system toxin component, PIN family [Anaerolineaceae bacterium]|nr:putative toxin-antitoxin system toxin component, PIN family [Anaerolineaceae bacterium]
MKKNNVKAVIDTQLFLRAAINPNSLAFKIIFDLDEQYTLVASKAIISEVRNVLYRWELRIKFPHLTDRIAERLLSAFARAEVVEPDNVPSVSRDPKDDKFIACAVAAKANYIISEDKDLLVLNPYQGIQIINALDFLNVLQNISPET